MTMQGPKCLSAFGGLEDTIRHSYCAAGRFLFVTSIIVIQTIYQNTIPAKNMHTVHICVPQMFC